MILYRIAKLLEERSRLAERIQQWDGDVESFIHHHYEQFLSPPDDGTAFPQVHSEAVLEQAPEVLQQKITH